jgi:hypothetical protein
MFTGALPLRVPAGTVMGPTPFVVFTDTDAVIDPHP